MAVQMAVQRGRDAKRGPALDESIKNKLFVLPDKKERLFDVELGVLMLNGYSYPSYIYPLSSLRLRKLFYFPDTIPIH